MALYSLHLSPTVRDIEDFTDLVGEHVDTDEFVPFMDGDTFLEWGETGPGPLHAVINLHAGDDATAYVVLTALFHEMAADGHANPDATCKAGADVPFAITSGWVYSACLEQDPATGEVVRVGDSDWAEHDAFTSGALDPDGRPSRQALLDKVAKVILDADWRSGEESWDYGYGGETYSTYESLDEHDVWPVAEQIVDLVLAARR